MKKFILLMLIAVVFAACEKPDPIAEMEGDATLKSTELVGAHFNLNLIGTKDKTMPDDIAAGHVIFVKLGEVDNPKTKDVDESTTGETLIYLEKAPEGESYAVLDKNGTDGEASLQLPDPMMEPYVTELPDGYDTKTDYSVYARPLGKPLTGSTIELIANLTLEALGEYITDRAEKRVWDNLLAKHTVVNMVWGEQIANAVTFAREKKKSVWQNITTELLTVLYEIEVLVDLDEDPGTTGDQVWYTFHVRIPIFDPLIENEHWKYSNDGLRLLQLRFYPFEYDVSQDDDFIVDPVPAD